MNAFLLAKKYAAYPLIGFIGASVLSPDPVAPDMKFVLDLAKIAAYLGFAILCWKVGRPVVEFSEELRMNLQVFRLMRDDYFDKNPEVKENLYVAAGRDMNRHSFFFNGRRKN